MASLNKATLIGNLGRDPEVRYLPSGDAVANLSLATTDKWKDKNTGEQKEATEWHRISFFGKLADICGQYLKKGSQVYIEGKITTRKYTDKDGIEKYSTEIRGEAMVMLGSPSGGSSSGSSAPPQQRPTGNGDTYRAAKEGRAPMPAPSNINIEDDDIPF